MTNRLSIRPNCFFRGEFGCSKIKLKHALEAANTLIENVYIFKLVQYYAERIDQLLEHALILRGF
jgi:hypothetical protein